MSKPWTVSTVYMTYITNQPYIYPRNNVNREGNTINATYNTGWHILPTILNKHFFTPKAWAELCINNQAYHVKGYTIELFNPVPLTTQLAIQGTTAFTAFNNTIYGFGYQDQEYETPWENWFSTTNAPFSHNLVYKEGLIQDPGQSTGHRYMLPIYAYDTARVRLLNQNTANFPTDGTPTGIFWDPFNDPDNIMEIRPGKNAIRFSWECHPTDADKWFNLDTVMSWYPYKADGPYQGNARPQTLQISKVDDPDYLNVKYNGEVKPYNDFTWPNWANQPIVPMNWAWKEMQCSIVQPMRTNSLHDQILLKPDFFYAGTESEIYKYPPKQCFCKLLPIFDDQGHNISISACISVKQTLHLEVKPRKSALYAPTWGPFRWSDIYSAKSEDLQFQTPIIRVRTAGMRRTWQNIQRTYGSGDASIPTVTSGYAREDPYQYPPNSAAIVPDGGGVGGTRSAIGLNFGMPKNEMQITINKDTPERHIRIQSRKKSPEPMEDNDI